MMRHLAYLHLVCTVERPIWEALRSSLQNVKARDHYLPIVFPNKEREFILIIHLGWRLAHSGVQTITLSAQPLQESRSPKAMVDPAITNRVSTVVSQSRSLQR